MKWAVIVWSLAVLGGTGAVVAYKLRPGAAAEAPHTWPAGSALARTAGRPTLLVMAQPMCPCTEATLEQLAHVLSDRGDTLDTFVVFTIPEGAEDWERSSTLKRARAMKGVTVLLDRDGSEAVRFGSYTSGQVLFFDASGELKFAGGITGGRGHQGDNAGESRLLAVLAGARPERATAPVFGCELHRAGGAR
ncbi:MAG: RedB protein [Myxococcaceae bacterium]